ncbi:uncharacterized protein DUF4405 [Serratia fonticola]|uniref:Uncharacterized protein DUF4405 n=1 Tax=Serratia fonticola TaxID=47917 RepID=A0A542BLD8_SERFO|nr:DUF4405 domain-containing protein [Serratia fonticola]TQI79402.1 uncharacterized protein DUF4405 [Serratia fonticola]TQI98573.1 uncharacterized protein DUF4405 [Serratia fonticola]TVZ68101.1 uncharacterized protein DUF4405 [Serratia fonticola]
MKAKYKFQVLQDVLMAVVLFSLMGFHLWGESLHEWLGIFFLCLILLHNGLNVHWYQNLFQTEYTLFNTLRLGLNLLLILLFSAVMVSGAMLSRHVLADLPFHNPSDLVRKIHMVSVHWGLIIIALHVGMHWKMLANFFCKVAAVSPHSFLANRLMPTLFLSMALYGLYVFISRNRLPYLLMQVEFAFFDFEESKIAFYLDYLAMTLFFAYLTRFLLWIFMSTRGNLN